MNDASQEKTRLLVKVSTMYYMDGMKAIAAALRGKCLDVLVTDMDTAKRLLDWQHNHPARSSG